MIVPSMNSEELTKEIFQDYPMVLRKAMYLTESLRRKALKSKNKYCHQIFEYKSSRKNNWLIIVDYYVAEPTFQVVVYYLNEFGFNAMRVDGDQTTLSHYSSHFLDRFNERFLKQENISKLEILKRFLTKNSVGSIEKAEDSDGFVNRFFGRVREGINLGFVESINYLHKIIHHKTFISNDMIFESQKGVFDLTGEHYKAYWNETFKHTRLPAFN
jgi:hypothetical protein